MRQFYCTTNNNKYYSARQAHKFPDLKPGNPFHYEYQSKEISFVALSRTLKAEQILKSSFLKIGATRNLIRDIFIQCPPLCHVCL